MAQISTSDVNGIALFGGAAPIIHLSKATLSNYGGVYGPGARTPGLTCHMQLLLCSWLHTALAAINNPVLLASLSRLTEDRAKAVQHVRRRACIFNTR